MTRIDYALKFDFIATCVKWNVYIRAFVLAKC